MRDEGKNGDFHFLLSRLPALGETERKKIWFMGVAEAREEEEILWSVVEDTEKLYEVSFTDHEIPIFSATTYGEARNDILIDELSDAILSKVAFVCWNLF